MECSSAVSLAMAGEPKNRHVHHPFRVGLTRPRFRKENRDAHRRSRRRRPRRLLDPTLRCASLSRLSGISLARTLWKISNLSLMQLSIGLQIGNMRGIRTLIGQRRKDCSK